MPIIDIYPEPFVSPSAVYRWPFIFDILPTDMLNARGFNWLPRVKADSVEKLITQAVIDENESNVGQELTIDLANPADRTAFTSSADIDFGIGKKISGAWDESTFLNLLENATTQRINYTIAGQGAHTTSDRASIVISSAENDRLNKTSESGLILYDPLRVSVSDTDANPVQGFTTELMDIPGMTLEDILQELLVERCGFDSYVTDLPDDDYPIQRVDVTMGARFWDAIGPHIAMYYPAVRIIGNVIHIYDSTVEQPENFPALYEVTLAVTKDQLNLSQEKQKLDGLFLTSTGLDNNYDYTTIDFRYSTETPSEGVVTDIERAFVEFRKITSPTTSVVVREELNFENKDTEWNGLDIESSVIVNEFNISEIAFRHSTVHKRLPNLPVGDTSSLQLALEERESITHQVHPFRPTQKFIARRELRVTGLITIDEDNPNISGDAARQEAGIAFRSNNFISGQTYEYGRLRSRTEKSEPLRDGTVRVTAFQVDEVNGIVTQDEPQIRAGEIGVNNTSTSQQTIAVFAEDNTTRSTQRMDSLNINELPLKYGHPLARRILKNRQTTNQNVTLPIIGYDPYLQKGVLIAPKDRSGISLGNFIISGRRIVINRETGLTMELQARQVANTASTITIQSGPQSSQYGILEGTNQIFPLQIECGPTTYLSIDPVTVADLGIEARESTQGSYTDLEAGILDLSSFSGIKTINIRVTAGAIAGTQPVRRVFDLITNAVAPTIEVLTYNGETVTYDGDPVYIYA